MKERLVPVEADSSVMVLGMVDSLPPFIGKVKPKSGTITLGTKTIIIIINSLKKNNNKQIQYLLSLCIACRI